MMEEIQVKQERGQIQDVDPDYTAVETLGLRLDLACGERKDKGFTGVDAANLSGVDIICNLDEYDWPFEEHSVIEIRCSHYLEHTKDIKRFMEEAYRVLTPSGIMTITCPYYTSVRAFMDYTHVRPISENTFIYFNQPWLASQLLKHYNVQCDFDINSIRYIFSPAWEPRANEAREYARTHYWNVVQDIIIQLRAVKPMREK